MQQRDPQLISHYTLRKAIGWLGMLLPFILLIGNYIINESTILKTNFWVNKHCTNYIAESAWKSSISHYYYTAMGEAFTGVLIAVGLFMICYKGYPKKEGDKGLTDNATTSLAGIFALLVVIFPTSNDDACIGDNFRVFVSSEFTGKCHLVFACLFFGMLIHMCYFNFRRGETAQLFGKGVHQKFYKLCAVVMLLCIVCCGIYILWLEKRFPYLVKMRLVFVFESIALVAFGLSWLTKGKVDYYYLPKKLGVIKNTTTK
jgi:hypothetical protein